MIFLKKVAMMVYMVLMLAVGVLFFTLSLNIVPSDQWAKLVDSIAVDIDYQIAVGVIGIFFIVLGIIVPYRFGKKLKKSKFVSFQNPDGEVTVSLTAIEEYILKIAKAMEDIKDVRSKVDAGKRGIDIRTEISMIGGANIPEITERIQSEVKNKLHNMLGVEEKINMRIHVKKIAKTVAPENEAQESTAIPFREMD